LVEAGGIEPFAPSQTPKVFDFPTLSIRQKRGKRAQLERSWNARKRAIISDRPFLLRGTLTLESQNLGSQNPAHLIDPSSSDALGQHHCLEEPALHKPRNLVAPYAPMPCHRAVEYHFSGSII